MNKFWFALAAVFICGIAGVGHAQVVPSAQIKARSCGLFRASTSPR